MSITFRPSVINPARFLPRRALTHRNSNFVLLTLSALAHYSRVAQESPHVKVPSQCWTTCFALEGKRSRFLVRRDIFVIHNASLLERVRTIMKTLTNTAADEASGWVTLFWLHVGAIFLKGFKKRIGKQ